MSAVIEHGCHKSAAKALGIEPHTVEVHLGNVTKKMPQRHRLQRLIAWDRWARQQGGKP